MINIAFVSLHAEMVGGGEHSLLDLMTHLPKTYQATLITPAAGAFSQAATQRDVAVQYLPMPKLGIASFVALKTWLVFFKRLKPDLIHANNSRAAFYAGIVGKILAIPVLFHCRIAEQDPKLDWLLVRLVDAVVVNSHATAERFKAWQDLNLHVVYNGIDVSHKPEAVHIQRTFGQRAFGAKVVMLCVARVSRWKRHDIVLQTFEQLAAHIEGLHLVCVGGADPNELDWWQTLQEKTAQSDFTQQIHWLGLQTNVAPWYQQADILFLASKKEPFGRVIIEAMGHKLAVIAFNQGGPSEIMTDGVQGILLEEDDDVVVRLKPVFESSALRQQFGEAGYVRAKDFSLEQHVRKMDAVFKSLVGQ